MGPMPSTLFERQAIAEFLNQLTAQTGALVENVSYPEDDPGDLLTVDAAARVDGTLWAIDHMRLAYEPTVVPAGDEATRKLWGPLEELAGRYGCCLYVGVLPSRRRARTRKEIDAYYRNIVNQAEAAINSGQDWFDSDGFTSVQVSSGISRPVESEPVWYGGLQLLQG